MKIDPKELLMRDMYVCMGNAGTTETEAWYATAKLVNEQTSTYTTISHHSIDRPLSSKRPTSARPTSAYSDPYTRADSGMGSSVRSSAKNTSYTTLYQSKYTTNETEDDIMMSKLFGSESKPLTPRITDNLCVISKEHQTIRPNSSVVYASPKKEKSVDFDDAELGIIDDDGKDKDDEKDSGKGDDENGDSNESVATESEHYQTVTVNDVDEVGSIIVGVVLKKVVKKLTTLEESEIENLPEIQDIFQDKSYSNLTMESLDKITFVEEGANRIEENNEEENEQKISEEMSRNLEEESDVDSLLDSEEDFEEMDTFFRKHKHRTYSLCYRKGVEQFKKFLKGTQGERNWKFWVDIDRMRLMLNEKEIQL